MLILITPQILSQPLLNSCFRNSYLLFRQQQIALWVERRCTLVTPGLTLSQAQHIKEMGYKVAGATGTSKQLIHTAMTFTN